MLFQILKVHFTLKDAPQGTNSSMLHAFPNIKARNNRSTKESAKKQKHERKRKTKAPKKQKRKKTKALPSEENPEEDAKEPS